jgi:hypothetical protein
MTALNKWQTWVTPNQQKLRWWTHQEVFDCPLDRSGNLCKYLLKLPERLKSLAKVDIPPTRSFPINKKKGLPVPYFMKETKIIRMRVNGTRRPDCWELLFYCRMSPVGIWRIRIRQTLIFFAFLTRISGRIIFGVTNPNSKLLLKVFIYHTLADLFVDWKFAVIVNIKSI